MGSFPISFERLRDELSNMVGVRTGLAWSESELNPHIKEFISDFPPGAAGIRMRASDFKGLTFSVLRSAGDTWTSMGYRPRLNLIFKIGEQRYILAADILHQEIHQQDLGSDRFTHTEDHQCRPIVPVRSTSKTIAKLGYDPSVYAAAAVDDRYIAEASLATLDDDRFLGVAMTRYGREVRDDCAAILHTYRCEQRLDPWQGIHRKTATDLLDLSSLYEKSAAPCPKGSFIDQRFIDHLYANLDAVSHIHWRQFERLVAEYLHRQGYFVQLGPGGSDDGVDIRMWPTEPQAGEPPLVIVQCKRQQSKVEKVIVKALWADVVANSSMRGLVATTSTLSVGAAKTIDARGYGIDVADHSAVRQWLTAMRTPGTGISMAEIGI